MGKRGPPSQRGPPETYIKVRIRRGQNQKQVCPYGKSSVAQTKKVLSCAPRFMRLQIGGAQLDVGNGLGQPPRLRFEEACCPTMPCRKFCRARGAARHGTCPGALLQSFGARRPVQATARRALDAQVLNTGHAIELIKTRGYGSSPYAARQVIWRARVRYAA